MVVLLVDLHNQQHLFSKLRRRQRQQNEPTRRISLLVLVTHIIVKEAAGPAEVVAHGDSALAAHLRSLRTRNGDGEA
jgi:hypothetical protein